MKIVYDSMAKLEERNRAIEEHRKKVLDLLQEGIDYAELKIGNRPSKPSLTKAGAERIAMLHGFRVEFRVLDVQPLSTSDPSLESERVVIVESRVYDPGGNELAQGVGSYATIEGGKSSDRYNRAFKMAYKRAYVDGILRALGLSSLFTQDMEEPSVASSVSSGSADQDDIELIIRQIPEDQYSKIVSRYNQKYNEEVDSIRQVPVGFLRSWLNYIKKSGQ